MARAKHGKPTRRSQNAPRVPKVPPPPVLEAPPEPKDLRMVLCKTAPQTEVWEGMLTRELPQWWPPSGAVAVNITKSDCYLGTTGWYTLAHIAWKVGLVDEPDKLQALCDERLVKWQAVKMDWVSTPGRVPGGFVKSDKIQRPSRQLVEGEIKFLTDTKEKVAWEDEKLIRMWVGEDKLEALMV